MIDSPKVAGDYYQKIADRIAVGHSYFDFTIFEVKLLDCPRILASAFVNASSNSSKPSILLLKITTAKLTSPLV
jgi:hypothetical protein